MTTMMTSLAGLAGRPLVNARRAPRRTAMSASRAPARRGAAGLVAMASSSQSRAGAPHADVAVVTRGGKAEVSGFGSSPTTLYSNAALLWTLANYTPAEGTGGSLAVTLGLFVMSAPGLYSLVKRSTKSKTTRKTYEIPGPTENGGKPLDETAREIAGYFKKMNYNITNTGEVITFEGRIKPERGTAAYITFCVVLGLASTALVLSTAFPDIGNWWYALCLLSPGAWIYYMGGAERVEEVKVKMVTADDEKCTDITLEGDKEELERFCETLGFTPKGMVKVEGILSQ